MEPAGLRPFHPRAARRHACRRARPPGSRARNVGSGHRGHARHRTARHWRRRIEAFTHGILRKGTPTSVSSARSIRNSWSSIIQRQLPYSCPTIVPENFPLTGVEAAACGTPSIVAKSSGGGAELVIATGGWLLHDGDEELAAAIRRLVEDTAFRNELGARARACYVARSTKGHIYRRLLEAHRGNPA